MVVAKRDEIRKYTVRPARFPDPTLPAGCLAAHARLAEAPAWPTYFCPKAGRRFAVTA